MGANQSSGPPRVKTTDEIGLDLEQKYGKADPDVSIDFFYIRFGQEIIKVLGELADQKKLEVDIIAELNGVLGETEWKAVKPGWTTQGLVIVEPSKDGKNECEKEQNFNTKQEKLITKLETLVKDMSPSPAVHVMFSQACLYTNYSREDGMTTNQIAVLLKECPQEDRPIDYFYLFVHAKYGSDTFVSAEGQGGAEEKVLTRIQDSALLILRTLPGEWKAVLPQDTWPGVFFGYFPKRGKLMSERERESKLNEEVRIPLIGRLKHQLAQITGGKEPKATAHVIITRACKYTQKVSDSTS